MKWKCDIPSAAHLKHTSEALRFFLDPIHVYTETTFKIIHRTDALLLWCYIGRMPSLYELSDSGNHVGYIS